MMNWIAFWEYSTPSTETKGFEPESMVRKRDATWLGSSYLRTLMLCIGLLGVQIHLAAQNSGFSSDCQFISNEFQIAGWSESHTFESDFLRVSINDPLISVQDTVPEPKHVMRRSMFIPGWGQATNKQIWKVPVIYGLFAGMAAYTIYTNNRYQGYRAAYYNSFEQNTDLRFGPTPGYILAGQPPELYRSNRNNFRNQRDMSIIGLVLIYGLNVADAYIFAQLRDFDVSDNLSGNISVDTQQIAGQSIPNVKLTINLSK